MVIIFYTVYKIHMLADFTLSNRCMSHECFGKTLYNFLSKELFKIFGSSSKDTYRDICKYFGVYPIEEEITVRQSKFMVRYHASDGDVCRAISKLK